MNATSKGKVFMIPVPLGEGLPEMVLPATVQKTIEHLSHYIVENEKTARRFIKLICPQKAQSTLTLYTLNKHTQASEHKEMLQACLTGIDIGIMSESGCPGIADPGAAIVKLAHELGIQVIPLVGPSSILLALMASGMNGQQFAFNGYLPIDKAEKKSALRNFEKSSAEKNQTQIFIETPYRNNKLLEDMLQILQPETLLCVAADITLTTESIKTMKVKDWRKCIVDLQNRPAIFLIHKP